jgi:hypothetical protein
LLSVSDEEAASRSGGFHVPTNSTPPGSKARSPTVVSDIIRQELSLYGDNNKDLSTSLRHISLYAEELELKYMEDAQYNSSKLARQYDALRQKNDQIVIMTKDLRNSKALTETLRLELQQEGVQLSKATGELADATENMRIAHTYAHTVRG